MYGILSLIGKKYGKNAMRRVLAIAQQFPKDRKVMALQNKGAPGAWYETGQYGGRGGFSLESRLGAAEGLLRNASKYITPENKATPYSGIMQTMKSKLNSKKTTQDLVNWYRANPDEYAKMNEAGRTYWGEFGGEEYVDRLAQNAIAQMSKRNFQQRGMTEYEKYMVALARQRRQNVRKSAEIIPFPKRK
jgi:hypothetical protein